MKKILTVIWLMFVLNLSYSQWVPVFGGTGGVSGNIVDLTALNSNLLAVGSPGVFRSTNNGSNWILTTPQNLCGIAVSGTYIFVGVRTVAPGFPEGIYRSTNNGISYALVGLNNKPIFDIVADNNQIVAISVDGVSRSTNVGLNWTSISASLLLGVSTCTLSENGIYAGGQGLHYTSNGGTNWQRILLMDDVMSIYVNDSLILTSGIGKGIFRSTNMGLNWQRTLTLNKTIHSFYQYGQNIFAGADTGFYVSTDLGANFSDFTQGLGNARNTSILISNNYIFVSNDRIPAGASIQKRLLSEIIGISSISTEIPNSYLLSQNYPNPFNPTTKIRFDVPKTENVVLKVYDILGREIKTLVNQQLKPGTYETDWDASGYSSGIYYYKITAGEYSETKKMVLVK